MNVGECGLAAGEIDRMGKEVAAASAAKQDSDKLLKAAKLRESTLASRIAEAINPTKSE